MHLQSLILGVSLLAPGEPHWSYQPPKKAALPPVANEAWCRDPIDRFVLARLESEGLTPSPEADKATLLRRVSLDLIGLPPTEGELAAFLADGSADAYEKVVDRLLASPHYGERMARPWLDLARYADTNGYEKDLPRALFPWRDWVIHALNTDLPFDRFTIEQLAGDLLPSPTPSAARDQRVATGFHRNTLLNDEGGIDSEEFRVAAVIDRVHTTATVWLGTTLACAQCHDHKYDPFTQRDFYGLYAFFDQTADTGVGSAPEIELPTPDQEATLRQLDATIEQCRTALHPAAGGAVMTAFEKKVQKERAEQDAPPPAPFAGAEPGPEFERDKPFAYGGWAYPEESGAILGKIDDAHDYRGFDLHLNVLKVEVHLVHHWPDDGIKVTSKDALPKNQWSHVFMSYDGSGKAAGVSLFVDGKPVETVVANDTLQGSIRSDVPLKIGSRNVTGKFEGRLDGVHLYDRAVSAEELRRILLAEIAPALAVPREKRDAAQQEAIDRARTALAPQTPELRKRIDAAEKKRAAVAVVKSMVMSEVDPPRQTHVFKRGDFRNPLPEVIAPATPAILPPFDRALPRNRLGLAQWLTSSSNPLLGRVTVNRAWQLFFGEGLVTTPEDFGTKGERPSHPELLDWLAVDFVENGQSQKALHRRIVLSATYRQAAEVTPLLREKDPSNRLLARGARFRLEAEQLRDNALSIAGMLDPKIGGMSVMPPQPPGIWQDSFANFDTPQFQWREAQDGARFRRGIYTYLRRSALYPSHVTFDGARRDVCSVHRSRTNTPLQSLILLNDPVFLEAAAGLAKVLLADPGADDAARIDRGMLRCVSRRPTDAERAILASLLDTARRRFREAPGEATAMCQATRVDSGTDAAELAAWTTVSNALLNLDETITRG